jgi:hypothetical protein
MLSLAKVSRLVPHSIRKARLSGATEQLIGSSRGDMAPVSRIGSQWFSKNNYLNWEEIERSHTIFANFDALVFSNSWIMSSILA